MLVTQVNKQQHHLHLGVCSSAMCCSFACQCQVMKFCRGSGSAAQLLELLQPPPACGQLRSPAQTALRTRQPPDGATRPREPQAAGARKTLQSAVAERRPLELGAPCSRRSRRSPAAPLPSNTVAALPLRRSGAAWHRMPSCRRSAGSPCPSRVRAPGPVSSSSRRQLPRSESFNRECRNSQRRLAESLSFFTVHILPGRSRSGRSDRQGPRLRRTGGRCWWHLASQAHHTDAMSVHSLQTSRSICCKPRPGLGGFAQSASADVFGVARPAI